MSTIRRNTPSADPAIRAQCARKKYFRTRTVAEAAIKTRGITVYRCEACLGWHHTTKRPEYDPSAVKL